MEEAAKHYVHMDELMEAAGKRLAELTGAEWGGVFSGAAGALAASTAACMTGADPEKMALLPDVSSLKHEVLIHRSSRNVYDRSVWMTGAKMVEVRNAEEMDQNGQRKDRGHLPAWRGSGRRRGHHPGADRGGGQETRHSHHRGRRGGTAQCAEYVSHGGMRPGDLQRRANACGVPRARDCFWAEKTSSRRRSSTTRRTMPSAVP